MHKKMKTYLIGLPVIAIVMFSLTLFPVVKPGVHQLESRLETMTGEKRLGLLVELTKAHLDPEPEMALNYGKESLELLEHFPNPELQVDVLNDLGEACNSLGRYDASREYARKAGEIAEKIGYKKGFADSLYDLGRANYFQGIYNDAAAFFSRAREIYETIGHEPGLAKTLNAFGLVYWKLGDYSRALENILDSCKIRENLGGKSDEADRDIAYSYNNIGLIYFEVGDYEKSGTYLRKARQIHESIDNKSGIAIALNNLAGIYRDQNKYQEALDYYKKSLEIKEELGFKHGAAITLTNIGKVYEKIGNYPKALDYLRKGLDISQEINQQNVVSNTLIHIGMIKRKMGLYREGLQHINQALDIALKINIKAETREAYRELAEIYSALGDSPKTLHYLKKYKDINDRIFNETSSLKIAELQARYEMEKNEKEIALLKKNNAIYQLMLNRQRMFNYFIIIVSLLTLVVGFVIYTRYRLKLKISLALSNEIEEHKQTAQKLSESEEKFKILAESAIVGIYILQDNIIKYVNPGFLSIFGRQKHEVMGKSLLEFIIEEDRTEVMEKINQRTRGSDDTVCYESRIMNGNGEILHLESYGGLIHYQEQPAVLETVIDISKRKKSAEKLLRSQKLEAMGIMAGGISHDFNNLLAVMVGYLEMVKDEIQSGSPADWLVEDIEKSYSQAVELGKKMASFAKGGWINQQKVMLISILDSAINEFPQILSLMNTVSIPEDIWPVLGDERQLKQVFIYLMRNSREAPIVEKSNDVLPKPLGVSAENVYLQEENEFLLNRGKYVRVFLTDNNRDTPREQLEKVFEPSFSLAPSSGPKGMGLELAMCHSIIKKHNGHITVSAEPGKGTTFDFILPAYNEKAGKQGP